MLYNYKASSIMCEWNPHCMSRLLPARDDIRGGECLEVMIHTDGSVFHVYENGNFVTHLCSNLKDNAALRNFTCDTIPFVVHSNGGQYNPQEMLIAAYLIL